MKRIMKWTIVFLVLLTLVQGAYAYTVSPVTVNPSGDLTPGTAVTVSFSIQFASSGETFPSGDTIDLFLNYDVPLRIGASGISFSLS